MNTQITASEIIDAFGGTSKIALLCEISPSSVSDWRKFGIPKARMQFLKLARPDVFKSSKRSAVQ